MSDGSLLCALPPSWREQGAANTAFGSFYVNVFHFPPLSPCKLWAASRR
jgi:hypothetical protein